MKQEPYTSFTAPKSPRSVTKIVVRTTLANEAPAAVLDVDGDAGHAGLDAHAAQ